MKYTILNQNGKKLQIPGAYLEESGLAGNSKLDTHVLEQAVVILPQQMTALEMIHAMGSLMNLSFEMFSRLVDECGPCEDCYEECCEDCCEDCCKKSQCPYDGLDRHPGLDLSPEIRKILGIPAEMKLRFEVDEQDHSIKVYAAEEEKESALSAVPAWLLDVFRAVGLCLADLDDLIRDGEIVYGE